MFSLLVSVMGLWVLFFWFYRDYRVAKFRYELFVLRDRLFDLAAEGSVDFDSRAYLLLRSTINGHLQYGDRRGLAELLLGRLFVGSELRKTATMMYHEQWDAAFKGMHGNVKEQFVEIRDKVHLRVFEQILLTSSILTFALLLVGFSLVLYMLGDKARQVIARVFAPIASPEFLDEAALSRSGGGVALRYALLRPADAAAR